MKTRFQWGLCLDCSASPQRRLADIRFFDRRISAAASGAKEFGDLTFGLACPGFGLALARERLGQMRSTLAPDTHLPARGAVVLDGHAIDAESMVLSGEGVSRRLVPKNQPRLARNGRENAKQPAGPGEIGNEREQWKTKKPRKSIIYGALDWWVVQGLNL